MIDRRKLRLGLGMALTAALTVGVLNAVLVVTLGPKPTWLVPRQLPMGSDEIDIAERRLAGLLQFYQNDLAVRGSACRVCGDVDGARRRGPRPVGKGD